MNIIDLCWHIAQLVNRWQNKWKVVEKWMAIGGWRTEMEVWTCLMVVDVPAKTWHCFAETWCYVPLHCIIVSASFLPNPVASCPSFPSIINIPEFLVQWSGSLELYIVIHSYTKQISHKKTYLQETHICERHMVSWVSCRY